MDKYSFITNNCLGSTIYQKLNREYDNPFMGSYFQDDNQYLKFCLNFNYYINLNPTFSNPKLSIDTNNSEIPPDSFPVMFLDDVEIHWIHEKDKEICLNKYNRRIERLKKKIPFFIWGDSLLHIHHSDSERIKIISQFTSIKNSVYFNKDNIKEWSDKSFNDRVINNGWAQPLKWLDSNFIFNLLVDFFNNKKDKYSIVMPIKINSLNSVNIFINIALPLYGKYLETEYIDYFYIICPDSDISVIKKYTNKYSHIPFKFIPEETLLHSNVKNIEGWFKQQLIKLNVYSIIKTEYYLTVDSDLYLNQPLKYKDLFHGNKLKYSFEPWQEFNNKYYSTNSNWWKGSCNILNYNIENLYDKTDLMGVTPQIMVTKKVEDLIEYIKNIYGEEWQKIITDMKFTEYTLYWIFLIQNNNTNLYTKDGYPLWKHDLERNILDYDSEKNQKNIVLKSILEPNSYFSVIQSYLPSNINMLKYELFKNNKIEYDAIFLISSCLTPTQLKFFGVEDRFLQTLETVKSARKYIPNSLCILIEGSVLNKQHSDELVKHFDYILDFSEDDKVLPYVKNTNNIGHGEQKLLEKGIEFLQSKILPISNTKYIFKLGARYNLNDNFNILNYDPNKYNFYEEFDNGKSLQVYTTGLYSIPITHLDDFKKKLINIHNYLLTTPNSMIEKYFYDHIEKNNVNVLQTLGLEGRLNYNGHFFSK